MHFYCIVTENVGQEPAESFQLTISSGSGFQRTMTLPPLDPNETTEHCVLHSHLPSGNPVLSARVDPGRLISEMDETNNSAQWSISAPPALPPAGQTTIAPDGPRTVVVSPIVIQPQAQSESTAGPNLEVRAIRVRGKEPGGNNDCDPGENDVAVVVKNGGTAAAASFLVRLTARNLMLMEQEKATVA